MKAAYSLVIKFNLNPEFAPCPICNAAPGDVRSDWMGGGLSVFIEATNNLVCWNCVQDHSPLLADLVALLSAAMIDASADEMMVSSANFRQALHHTWEIEHLAFEMEGE